MLAIRIHFAVGFMLAKLSATTPRPGPRLFNVATTEANAEKSSTPVAIIASMLTIKTSA
ncbi:hypothetical protein D3C76_1582050 [compost metagenome]